MTSKYECSEEQFRKDTSAHVMTVLRDDGVNRHIRFKRPGTSCMYFDLITWPGCLCYTGDMGTYVFQRLEDMFEFFRADQAHRRDPNKLYINLGYWTEKLIAVDGNRSGGKVKEFSEEKFTTVINEYRVQWIRDAKESGSLDKEGRRELWEAVDDEVLRQLEDGGDRAQYAAYEFHHRPPGTRQYGWRFNDLFKHDFTEYTHSIVWCCYAIAWGVKTYDTAKAVPA